jgi:hypothetical protein
MAERKKISGINDVASVLKRYAPNKFKTTVSAKEKAREIIGQLKDEAKLKKNKRITVKSILSLTRKKKEQKPVFELPESLLKVDNYFALVGYPSEILTKVDNRIRFKSLISEDGLPMIQGGSEPDYATYFNAFVEWCNKMAALTDVNRYESNWFVRCTEPDSDLISYIIPCTENGKKFFYGFDTKKIKAVPKEFIGKDVEKPKEQPEEKVAEKKQVETDKEIELSKERQRESKQEAETAKEKKELLKDKMKAIQDLRSQGFTNAEILQLLG